MSSILPTSLFRDTELFLTDPLQNILGSAVPDRMSIAYEGASAAGAELQSRCPVPLPYNVDKDGVGAPFEHSLTFDSEFESGNLLRAVQRDDAAYDLFLRADLHTPGHTQWFYFAVSNTHPAALVRLAEQGVQVKLIYTCVPQNPRHFFFSSSM